MSDDEVQFLTQEDPEKEDNVLTLWHDNLKLLVVTDGEKGCRYFTKVLLLFIYLFFLVSRNSAFTLLEGYIYIYIYILHL